MKRVSALPILLGVMLLLLAPGPAEAAGQTVQLMNASAEVKLTGELRPDVVAATTRARPVVLSPTIADAARLALGDKLVLDLFDDARYVGVVDRINIDVNGMVSVRARIASHPLGYALFTTGAGTTLGSIRVPELNQRFQIRPGLDRRTHYLIQVDGRALDVLEGSPALIPPPPTRAEVEWMEKAAAARVKTDGATNVDVMIVYTPAAEADADAYEGSIDIVIAMAMEKAHLALDNSNTQMTMSLVHSALVDYVESGSVSTDLQRLTGTNDGYMDEVHLWRDIHGADLVALFAYVHDAGGVAYTLNTTQGRPTHGFSLTRLQQASWTYTHIHEMGHNMGAHHHKEQNVQPGPTNWLDWPENQWSAGWRWTGDDGLKYCDLMTYERGEYFADGIDHVRVAHFSNPDISFAGQPTGHPVHGDNARTVREVRHVIASYRSAQGATVTAHGETSVYGTVTGSYLDTAAPDGVVQTITEVLYTGHPRHRYSYLEHHWHFSLPPSDDVTFQLVASRSNNPDGDNFVFQYNAGGGWINLATVNSASPQSFAIPLGALSGAVTVRAYDTDRNWGNVSLDHLYVDYLAFVLGDTEPIAPTASFVASPLGGDVPLTVYFSDQSAGEPTSWAWDFGDGGVSTAQNPSYVYQTPGTYTVSLTVANDIGSDTLTRVDYITVTEPAPPPPPVAAFSAEPLNGEAPLQVVFSDQSTGEPTSWNWTFGDGGVSTAQNPTYVYEAPGLYTVSLTVVNDVGQDTLTKVDYITVTEPAPPGDDTMHVLAMAVSRKSTGVWRSGLCSVSVVDDGGAAVGNATVAVSYDGPNSGTLTGVTGSNGVVNFETPRVRNPSGEWCFEVTDITHAVFTYDPDANVTTRACESGPVYTDDGVFARGNLPDTIELGPNAPNPFNPITTIEFALPRSMTVRLTVFDVRGRVVTVLADGEYPGGYHQVQWDASQTASGLYFYRLESPGFSETRKMTILK